MDLGGVAFQGPHADDRRLADMRILRFDQSARNDQIIVPGIHLAAALLGPVFLGCLSGRKEGGDKALALFARDCDLLIHDSQYTYEDYNSVVFIKQGFGHSTFDMAIKEKENTHAKKLAFFHYDTTYNDEKLDEIKNSIINKTEDVIFPEENQKIEIL